MEYHYRVIGKTTCYICLPKCERIIDDSGIQAHNDAAARDSFTLKHKLCPHCLNVGAKAAVEFDPHIYIEKLPSL
jgi:hypothetical protein